MRASSFWLFPALGTLLFGASGCPAPEPNTPIFRNVAFPSDFVWGTATAQWQVEGDQGVNGPVQSNWSQWAAMGKTVGNQQNAIGNGFFDHYQDELDRAVSLGLTSIRLGIDWSRVEKEPGVFDDGELDHLRDVLIAATDRGLKPVLTLWHWTVPLWVQNPDPASPGGAVDLMADPNSDVVDRFEAFVRHVIPVVADLVDTYTVLNEPFSMISAGYIAGQFPPGKLLDAQAATAFGINLIFMHARAFDVIKELDTIDADDDGRASFVGLTMTANAFYPVDPQNDNEVFAAAQQSYVFNDWIMNALTTGVVDTNLNGRIDADPDANPPEGTYEELVGRLEFVGVQYYGPVYVKDDPLLRDFHPLYARPVFDVDDYAPERPHNGMGREISAGGFRDTLDLYASWGLPILLTENGTTTNDRPVVDAEGTLIDLPPAQEQAAMYVVEHLWEVGRAIERGVDIRGYWHWTLSDNFEWVEGTHQRFGAYSVDFSNPALPRTLTPMGEALRDVVTAEGIDETLWNTWVLDAYPTGQSEGAHGTTSEPVYSVPLLPD